MYIDKNTESSLFAKNPNLQLNGVTYLNRVWIELDEIMIAHEKNVARMGGINPTLIEELKNSFVNGVMLNEFLPVIGKLPVATIDESDGNLKLYEVYDGFNRLNALKQLGWKGYWFDLVDVVDERTRITLALKSNRHPPCGPSNDNDIYLSTLTLVKKGLLNNHADDIKDYIVDVTGIPEGRATQISNKVAKQTGAVMTFILWSADMIKNGLKALNIVSHGNYDITNGKHGWTCLEGYEADTCMNAIAKYHATKQESYIVGHTKLPNQKSGLDDRRLKMQETFNEKEEQLISLCEFYNKHGRLPFNLTGFLPQDNNVEPKNEIVPIK